MRRRRAGLAAVGIVAAIAAAALTARPVDGGVGPDRITIDAVRFPIEPARLAVRALIHEYGSRYPDGSVYLRRLNRIEEEIARLSSLAAGESADAGERLSRLEKGLSDLRQEVLLSNPLLKDGRVLLVKRKADRMGLPQNWQGNSSLPRDGYDNEIAVLDMSKRNEPPRTLYRPEGGRFVGDFDLHFDGKHLLFSMPDENNRWQVFEIGVDGGSPRRMTPIDPNDIDNFDACYLPGGGFLFCSTAPFQGVPCVGGADHVSLLYRMGADGRTIRQLTFDQDHNWNPVILNNGQVAYTRWEYSDTPHYFTRLLFQMNPDGTEQGELYGSNSYWPNSMFATRPLPGHPTKLVTVVSGHHGVPRMGELVLIDPAKGRAEADGAVQRIPGRGKPIEPIIRDQLVDASWPKFLHPFPISDTTFLVSCQPSPGAPWGIYLADIFDNLIPLRVEPGFALLEPILLRSRPQPPVIPDRVRLDRKDAVVHIQDIYAGPGLAGIPRGTVKRLRVYSNHYAFPGMGGHIHIGIDGPWDVKRILGTAPVYPDGSAAFRVPANTPIAVQPLDEEGKALQLMRSWMTAMPGETLTCVGCHEARSTSPPNRTPIASPTRPDEIETWRGAARGFSFAREVQPVLDRKCISCHDGQRAQPDFRGRERVVAYTGGFTPAYESLHRFVRRPGPESDYRLLMPMEFHADTSELVQMLRKGHHGVRLNGEEWDRIVTWIDLNVPCHGTWGEHRPIPDRGRERRNDLLRRFAGVDLDYEEIPPIPPASRENASSIGRIGSASLHLAGTRDQSLAATTAAISSGSAAPVAAGWPMRAEEAKRRQSAAGEELVLDLGGGVVMRLAPIPAGEFVMGDRDGTADEQPVKARIAAPFWIGRCEVTNEQFARFAPSHESGVISLINKDQTEPGYRVDLPGQPVVRVSWREAAAFCRWLSARTGRKVFLPTEVQWEYACRAGTATPFSYGDWDADPSPYANLADAALSRFQRGDSPDWMPKERQYNDGEQVTAVVGRYGANRWDLFDMHGNAAEWTRSADGNRKVIRGGSWYDRRSRARSGSRWSYPPYQGVFNVGFRIVVER